MTERELSRAAARGWAIIRHSEEVTRNVARTCRYFGISRQQYYTWLRRYEEQGIDGLRPRSRRPHASPNATSGEVIGKIVYLRKTYHFGPRKISMGNDTLADIEGAHGSRNGDTLTGDTGDNVFALEGGDDAVNAAGGADLIFYPEPPLEAEGVNVDLTVGTAMGAGSDSLTGIEERLGHARERHVARRRREQRASGSSRRRPDLRGGGR